MMHFCVVSDMVGNKYHNIKVIIFPVIKNHNMTNVCKITQDTRTDIHSNKTTHICKLKNETNLIMYVL